MTLIGEAVRSILLANAKVSSIVGSRIFPLELPLTCYFPAISYIFPSEKFKRVARPTRLQINCWAEDYTECENLKNAVEGALDGYSGTVSGIKIEGIFPISPYDRPIDETGLFHVVYDFNVIYWM